MLRIRRQIRQVSSAEMRAALPEKICEIVNTQEDGLYSTELKEKYLSIFS